MLRVSEISGPLVTATIDTLSQERPKVLETVFVGHKKLLGEVVAINEDRCKIQVYEETAGIMVGEPVILKNELLSIELGPGLLGTMLDGIGRPLARIDEISPVFIQPGIHLPTLDRSKSWDFIPVVNPGTRIETGSKLGYVMETELLKHWILVPHGVKGELISIESGEFKIDTPIAQVQSESGIVPIHMAHSWAVKIPRPIRTKLSPKKIFRTGQRVIDSMFPILLGAPVCTPGPFGAGKTFTQQQLAKWSDAQIVVYVGCGERGNEMTEMVKLFPTLTDPRTQRPLMERTVLIANTSNMPIAAREASIYTGITIAEYFRDMGYDVVLMADSTSRWAESMREISARLGEMPADEGYPAYLASKVAAFYERAGVVQTCSLDEGSVTAIGTVSPAGGDFSEPVTQASLKSTQVFLALDEKLASKRHYPAINWATSYSLYDQQFDAIVSGTQEGMEFAVNRQLARKILSNEDNLVEMVKLVGLDGLDNADRLILEISRSIREDFLQQNGFDEVDTYCSFEKSQAMLKVIIDVYKFVLSQIESNPLNDTLVADFFNPTTRSLLSNMKYKDNINNVLETKNDILKHVHNEVLSVRI